MKHLFLGLFALLLSLTTFTTMASVSTDTNWSRNKSIIVDAAIASGTSPKLLSATGAVETGYVASAKNRTGSSARGMFQITRPTGRHLVKTYGKQLKLGKNPNMYNASVNAKLAGAYLEEIRTEMENKLGRPVTLAENYLGYKFSPDRAVRMIKGKKSRRMVDFYPAGAKGNAKIYYDKGRARSVGEVMNLLTARINKAMNQYGNEAERLANNRQLDNLMVELAYNR